MVEVVEENELESVVVYECPDCGEYFTREEADPEGTNRSPCCGKMGSKYGEGLHVEDEVVIIKSEPESDVAFPSLDAVIAALREIRGKLASTPMDRVGGYGTMTEISRPLDAAIEKAERILKGA